MNGLMVSARAPVSEFPVEDPRANRRLSGIDADAEHVELELGEEPPMLVGTHDFTPSLLWRTPQKVWPSELNWSSKEGSSRAA
jgi:hypothetical protein